MSDYHTIIIGAGSGGLTVAVGLTGFGKSVALIEKNHVGGDCTNVGCVPSKILINEVNNLHSSGLSPQEILSKVREKRDHLRDEETDWVNGIEKVELIEGAAEFITSHQLRIKLNAGGKQEINAKNIVIATGSSPIKIPIEGLSEERTLTNENIFELESPPEHLAIIGAGVIGTELAFAFRKLGSKVSLIDLAPRVMSVVSEKASQVIHESLIAKEIDVYVGTKATHYNETTQNLYLESGLLEGVDKVLLAIGRAPNINNLGLTSTGVNYSKRGISTNAYGATNIKGLYAIGDVTPQSNFTHSANAQGRRLVTRIALPILPHFKAEPPYPSATFSEPEISQVGPNLAQLQEKYHPKLIRSFEIELKNTDKGYTESLTAGFVTIHAMHLTGRVLSAEIVAPKASEMISLLTLAVYQGISLYKLSGLIYPYPTFSEGIKKLADKFTLETLPKLPKELIKYLRYRPISFLRKSATSQ